MGDYCRLVISIKGNGAIAPNTPGVYVNPSMFELYQAGKASEAAVQLLIIRALDADGTPHFKKLDKTELMRSADSEVIGAIVEQISANDTEGGDSLGN